MVKLIIGLKGTGKTKTLIGMVNSAIDSSDGAVVCLEKGDKLRFDIKYQARLIDVDEYGVDDGQALYGFIAGFCNQNVQKGYRRVFHICQRDRGVCREMEYRCRHNLVGDGGYASGRY